MLLQRGDKVHQAGKWDEPLRSKQINVKIDLLEIFRITMILCYLSSKVCMMKAMAMAINIIRFRNRIGTTFLTAEMYGDRGLR